MRILGPVWARTRAGAPSVARAAEAPSSWRRVVRACRGHGHRLLGRQGSGHGVGWRVEGGRVDPGSEERAPATVARDVGRTLQAWPSQMKPWTQRPSDSSRLPRPSGGGMRASSEPRCRCGTAQTSMAMAAPPLSPAASAPGPALGHGAGQGVEAVAGGGVVASMRVAPRSSSCALSGMPVRCAPTTASGSQGSLAGTWRSGRHAPLPGGPSRAGVGGGPPVESEARQRHVHRRGDEAHASRQAFGVKPAGSDSAHQPSRLTKLV